MTILIIRLCDSASVMNISSIYRINKDHISKRYFMADTEDRTNNTDGQPVKNWRLPDGFTLLRWVFINLPYAFAGLLIGIYFFYLRDYGQGLSTIIAIATFALLFVVPFYIGEKASKLAPPLNIPLRVLHFTAVTGVQMVLVFLIVLTVLLKDQVDQQALPETPVSERLGGTPGLPEEVWPLVPEEGRTAPDDHLPDDREALASKQDTEVSEAEAVDDDPREEDAIRKLFMNILDRAELALAVADSENLGRFPLQTFFSILMGLAAGLLSWMTFKKRPWRIKFEKAQYEEDDPFRVPMNE
jgi:hypothetical protein